MTTLADVLGAPPAAVAVVAALAAGLGAALGVSLVPSGLSPDETALAESLVRVKYQTDDWTAEGRLPGAVAAIPAGAVR
jgi:hypothetical protein